MTTTTKSAVEQLARYIKAKYPVIVLNSHEESRVMKSIEKMAVDLSRKVATWSYTSGLEGLDGVDASNYEDPNAVLEFIATNTAPDARMIFVLKDAHNIIGQDVRAVRYIRDIANAFETSYNSLIFLSPFMAVPADLEKTAVVMDWPLPEADELSVILKASADATEQAGKEVHLNGSREDILRALSGLTAFEARSALASAISATQGLTEKVIPFIVKEKASIIKKSGVLEYFDTSDISMDKVGGLPYLKEYAEVKRAMFSQKAKDAGVDTPKGVMLVGVPGTGKSLSAKAIAGGLMPLLRLDFGALMGSLQGQSENNLRTVFKVAEAVAPCVLWVDEMEKAMSGIESSSMTDGGVTLRMFGSFLTWMQETTAPVYIVATANDVRMLKPELLSRFDDIIWVDLPNFASRAEILKVHLSKRRHDLTEFPTEELHKVVNALWGYSGREIEKVVKTAIERSFFEDTALTAEHLLKAAKQIIPISTSMAEVLSDLRSWAINRAIQADNPLEAQPKEEKKIALEL